MEPVPPVTAVPKDPPAIQMNGIEIKNEIRDAYDLLVPAEVPADPPVPVAPVVLPECLSVVPECPEVPVDTGTVVAKLFVNHLSLYQ